MSVAVIPADRVETLFHAASLNMGVAAAVALCTSGARKSELGDRRGNSNA